MKATIGFLQIRNAAGDIEDSSNRLKELMAAFVAFLIAIGSILPWFEITLGDSWPMVITLLGYSLGNSTFKAIIDRKPKKDDVKQ